MRFSSILVIAAASLYTGLSVAATVDGVPACGLLCVLELVSSSSCGTIGNTTCICTNEQFNEKVAACVLRRCSIRESLAMQKYSDQSCDRPLNDTSLQALIVTPLFGLLAVVSFLLRILARYYTGLKETWRTDDWCMVPAVLASIPMTVICFILAKNGLGKDMWFVDPNSISWLLYLYYWGELLYLLIIPLTKISVLVFYLQIFPERIFKIGTYTLIVGNVLYCITFEIATIVQCTPVDGAWRSWDGTYTATCRNINLQAWVAAATCIVLDIAMLVLPMPGLWRLKLSMRKKLQVMFMFGLGVFVTVVSILRLQYLVLFTRSQNITRDFVPIGIWSVVEISTGIVCACLPALRTIFANIAPKIFGTTVKSITENTNSRASGYQIRVRSEFSVRSKRVDEGTFMELQPFDSDLEMQPHRKFINNIDFDDSDRPSAAVVHGGRPRPARIVEMRGKKGVRGQDLGE